MRGVTARRRTRARAYPRSPVARARAPARDRSAGLSGGRDARPAWRRAAPRL